MGYFLSKSIRTYHVYPCNCKRNSIATYRCQATSHEDFYYSPQMLDRFILADPIFTILQKQMFIRLKKYNNTSHFTPSTNTHTISWIACDLCITDNVKYHFTQHPDGWSDPTYDSLSEFIEFEPVKL
jgi:hypothetical protein